MGLFTSIRNLVTAPLKIVAAPVQAIVQGGSIAGAVKTQVNTGITAGQGVVRAPLVQAIAASAATVYTGGALAGLMGGGALATGVASGIAAGGVSKLQGGSWNNQLLIEPWLNNHGGISFGGAVGNLAPAPSTISAGLEVVKAIVDAKAAQQNYDTLAAQNSAPAPLPATKSIAAVAAGYQPTATGYQPTNDVWQASNQQTTNNKYIVPTVIGLAVLLVFALLK